MEFEDVVSHFAGKLTIIDNNLLFTMSHMMGARAFEVHLCNYWPEWGIKLLERLEAGDYAEVQRMMVEEAKPFYKLWVEIEKNFTSGDGYLTSSAWSWSAWIPAAAARPLRDVRSLNREKCRAMMIESGVPGVISPRRRMTAQIQPGRRIMSRQKKTGVSATTRRKFLKSATAIAGATAQRHVDQASLRRRPDRAQPLELARGLRRRGLAEGHRLLQRRQQGQGRFRSRWSWWRKSNTRPRC